MTITSQDLRRKLASGAALVGTFVATPSAEIVEMLGLAGFDFCVLDMEHAHFGTETIAHLLRAAELRGMAAIVRVPSTAPEQIGIVLDLGAAGVMIPGVASAEDGERMVALTRYPPLGRRGAHLSTRHLRYSATRFADVVGDPQARPFTVLQIESAVDPHGIEAIAGVDGLDVVFVGINDLSQSVGRGGDFEHEDVQSVVRQIVTAAKSRGVALGLWARRPADLGKLKDRGFSFLTVSNNELMFFEAAQAIAQAAKASLGADRESS